jgi:excisionase family DNA binding protein
MPKQIRRGSTKPRSTSKQSESAEENLLVQGSGKSRTQGRSPARDERPLTDLSSAPNNTLLTVEQARKVLNISDWFARRLIRDQTLPAIFIARNCIRIELGELREFIESRRSKAKGKT